MSTTTTNQQIVIPVGTDVADNPDAFVDMIARVENRLVQRYTSNADRAARNPTPATNEMSIIDGNTWYDRYTGTKWLPCTPISAVKTSDQTLTASSTVLQNVAALVVPAPVANTRYALEAFVFYDATTVADIKFTFTLPAAAELRFGGSGPAVGLVGSTGDGNYSGIFASGPLVLGGAGAGTFLCAHLYGSLDIAGTTGNVQMQAAQNTSEASVTRVLSSSWLRLNALS